MPMNPLVLYLVFVAVAAAVALSAMAMVRPMSRACPRCDADVRVDARACDGCGHAFG
jgi:predicted amidophosphoribosyltransferase